MKKFRAFCYLLAMVGVHTDVVRSRIGMRGLSAPQGPPTDYETAMMALGLYGMLEPQPETWCERVGLMLSVMAS